MKKIITIAILSALGSVAYAQDVENQEIETNKYQTYSYNIEVDNYKETYTEYDTTKNNATFMKEEAHMKGLSGKISYQATELSQIILKGRFAFGDAKYTGSYMGNPYGSLILNGLDRFVWEIGAEHKYKYVDLKDINVGLGINYRQLIDRLDQTVGGYKRINDLWYVTVSLDKEFQVQDWKITPMFTLKTLLKGTQRSYMSPVSPLTHRQKNGLGYDFKVAFEKKVENYNFIISPYFKTMSIADSEIVRVREGFWTYTTREPKNKTTEIGLTVGLNF